MKSSDNQDSAEPLYAETAWFHVFKDMIESGDMANLDGSAIKVYLVIKAHANFNSGQSFPALETISKKSGMSIAQVKRCLSSLESHGYVMKEKVGRNNLYILREKIVIENGDGHPTAIATWDYAPNAVKYAVADLRNVLVTGDIAGAKIVTINHLQMNIITGDGSSHVQIVRNESSNDAADDLAAQLRALPDDLRERVESIIASSKDRKKR